VVAKIVGSLCSGGRKETVISRFSIAKILILQTSRAVPGGGGGKGGRDREGEIACL